MENNMQLKFDLSPNQLKFRDILNKEFLELEIWAISDIDPNRNGSHFTRESMEQALPDMKNKPIVGFFDKGDFTTHEGKASYDRECDKEYWNTEHGERILGWIRESDPVEIVEKDGLCWIKARCALCVNYCYNQVKRLLKDRKKKVSVEIDVRKYAKRDDGIIDIQEFVLKGITILGSKNGKAVMEGIPDAHLSILEKLDDEYFNEQRKVLTFAYAQMDNALVTEQPPCDDVDVNNDPQLSYDGEGENSNKEVKEANMEHEKLECMIRDIVYEECMPAAEGHGEDCECLECCRPRYSLDAVYDDHIIVVDHMDNDIRYKVLYRVDGEIGQEQVSILWESKKSLEEIDKELAEAEAQYSQDCGEGTENVVSQMAAEDPENADPKPIDPMPVDPVQPSDDPEVSQNQPQDPIQVVDQIEVDTQDPIDDGHEDGAENLKNPENADPKVNGEFDAIIPDPKDAEIERLNAELESMKVEIGELNTKIAELNDKYAAYADYEEIKLRMEKAEAEVYKHYCDGLLAKAHELMEGEIIKDEDCKIIEEKCTCGKYSCEEEIEKDIAFAIYNARPVREKKFSVSLPVESVHTEVELTRQERMAARVKSK